MNCEILSINLEKNQFDVFIFSIIFDVSFDLEAAQLYFDNTEDFKTSTQLCVLVDNGLSIYDLKNLQIIDGKYRQQFFYQTAYKDEKKNFEIQYFSKIKLSKIDSEFADLNSEIKTKTLIKNGILSSDVQDLTFDFVKINKNKQLTYKFDESYLLKTKNLKPWKSKNYVSRGSENLYSINFIIDTKKYIETFYKFPNLISSHLDEVSEFVIVEMSSNKQVIKPVMYEKYKLASDKILYSFLIESNDVKLSISTNDRSKEYATILYQEIEIFRTIIGVQEYKNFIKSTKILKKIIGDGPILVKETKDILFTKLLELQYSILNEYDNLFKDNISIGQNFSEPQKKFEENISINNNQNLLLKLGNDNITNKQKYFNIVQNNTNNLFGSTTEINLGKNVKDSTDTSQYFSLNLDLTNIKDNIISDKKYSNPFELFYDLFLSKNIPFPNNIFEVFQQFSLEINKEEETKNIFNIIDFFYQTTKSKEVNKQIKTDETNINQYSNFINEIVLINLLEDDIWFDSDSIYSIDNNSKNFLPNSIKLIISRFQENSFERFDQIFYDGNKIRSLLYPIFFLKYLLTFKVEYFVPETDIFSGEKWKQLTKEVFENNPYLFCRIIQYENKKLVPPLWKKFVKKVDICNKYFILSKDTTQNDLTLIEKSNIVDENKIEVQPKLKAEISIGTQI